MTQAERDEVLAARQKNGIPWHRPPTYDSGCASYLITAACYEHRPFIGHTISRMSVFANELIEQLAKRGTIHAWAVLPNHYHVLILTEQIETVKSDLGKLHGRSSFNWNGEDGKRGRQVWHSAAETVMKSDRHFWATINYIHHNPVAHGHCDRWQDWAWSSARDYLQLVGRDRAKELWNLYPIRNYGREWDR